MNNPFFMIPLALLAIPAFAEDQAPNESTVLLYVKVTDRGNPILDAIMKTVPGKEAIARVGTDVPYKDSETRYDNNEKKTTIAHKTIFNGVVVKIRPAAIRGNNANLHVDVAINCIDKIEHFKQPKTGMLIDLPEVTSAHFVQAPWITWGEPLAFGDTKEGNKHFYRVEITANIKDIPKGNSQ